MSGPQRFLANDRNLIASATLTPSAVQSVANAVIETALARVGTAQLAITGSYTGVDDAVYDFEILDDDTSTKLVSTPVFSGTGSETLGSIVATSVAAQAFKVECHSAGQIAVDAAVEVDGVQVVARAPGAAGNGLHINVDVSGLSFNATAYSLIEDVAKGAGSESAPLDGPQYDFDAAVVGADNLIPTGAHRIAFDGDRSNVYVQYKRYTDGAWKYYFVPELANDYPAGTRVLFVTGSYAITLEDSASPPAIDTLSGVVTVYDFLNAIKTSSTMCDVDGVVANDRSPTGQASRELTLRTQARALLSSGVGSKAASGFTAITVQPDANTELITAECIAIDSKLGLNAYVGHEAWKLKGSVSGALGTVYTGDPYVGSTFGLTVPVDLPDADGAGNGKFTLSDVSYASRAANQSTVEICFAGKLGPNATDQTITLKYVPRPPADCNCEGMSVPELDTRCLGGAGGTASMGYSAGAQTRIDGLYDWVSALATKVTTYVSGKAARGITDLSDVTVDTYTITNTLALAGAPYPGGSAESPDISLTGVVNVAPYESGAVATGFADVALPSNFAALIDTFDRTLQAIDAIDAGVLQTAGFAAWDDAVAAIEDDLNDTELATLGHRLASVATGKYELMLRRASAAAGISPLGKTSASIQSGDGCWQDYGDAFYWEVSGGTNKYAPAFTNRAYWSSAIAPTTGQYMSTKEFAFIINVKCPEKLVEGDTVTLTIGNTSGLGTYQVGDVLKLPLIAAADIYLTGGIDASPVQSWYVTGSVDGPFAAYTFDPTAPAGYSSGGIAFALAAGGIPAAAGDTFQFSVEGGHFRWRKNGSAWSSAIAITNTPTALDSGLSYAFAAGVNPSYVTGDEWTFRALQPWAVANLVDPDRQRWFPGTTASNVYAEFASIETLDAIGIALHTIPQGATITLTGGVAVGTTDWTESITWQTGAIVQFLSQTRSARWTQLDLASATGASIGWWWVGIAAATEYSAAVTMHRSYRLDRGSAGGLYQGGAFLGQSLSGTVEWQPGYLTESDATMLAALLDRVKSNDDEAFLFVPQYTRSADALFVQVSDDDIEIADLTDYNAAATSSRKLSARLTLQGVWN